MVKNIKKIEYFASGKKNDLSSYVSFYISKSLLAPHLEASRKIEAKLDWPTGTIAILLAAFSRFVPRRSIWLFDTEDPPDSEMEAALKFAQSVYKRGPGSQPITGICEMHFTSQFQPIASFASNEGNFIVCDSGFYRCWDSLSLKVDYLYDPSEEDKSLESLSELLKTFKSKKNIETVIAFGGGITCDLVGFACSLLQIPYCLVPTTLLSMVDSSVGGKTGINFMPYGKNQIGRFAIPKRVYTNGSFLKTLNEDDLQDGFAEVFKHCLLAGKKQLAESFSIAMANRDFVLIHSLLPEIIEVKINFVVEDILEQCSRVALNLGHTLAHAIEAWVLTNCDSLKISHGKAVAIGLSYTLELSRLVADFSNLEQEAINCILKKNGHMTLKDFYLAYGGKVSPNQIWCDLWSLMSNDKKNSNNRPSWVLLRKWGQLNQNSSGSYLNEVSEKLCAKAFFNLLK